MGPGSPSSYKDRTLSLIKYSLVIYTAIRLTAAVRYGLKPLTMERTRRLVISRWLYTNWLREIFNGKTVHHRVYHPAPNGHTVRQKETEKPFNFFGALIMASDLRSF